MKRTLNFKAAGAGRFAPGRPWTCGRCACGAPVATVDNARCAAALPTAATFDHMPTAFDHEDGRGEAKTTASPRVTFLREATRPDFLSVAVYTGVDRQRNPYDLLLPPQSRPWLKKLQRDKTAAWWRGWDKADQQFK